MKKVVAIILSCFAFGAAYADSPDLQLRLESKVYTLRLGQFKDLELHLSGNNIDDITKVEICTTDVSCDYKCAVPLINKFSVIETAIGKEKLLAILEPLTIKYKFNIKLLY